MLRWGPDQLAEYQRRRGSLPASALMVSPAPTKKPSKHRNKRTRVGDITFDSHAEADRYGELERLERAGVIADLALQVPFILAPGVAIKGKARKSPPLRYFADFVYVRDGVRVIEDVKGQDKVTEGYRIKRHLMAVQGFHIAEIRKGR